MSSHSYQDLDTRLRRVEALLSFVAGSIQMTAVYQNGLVGPDGQPQRTTYKGSMMDLFKLQQVEGADVMATAAGDPSGDQVGDVL